MVNNNLIKKTRRDTRDIIVDSVYYSVDVKVLFELLLMKNTSTVGSHPFPQASNSSSIYMF